MILVTVDYDIKEMYLSSGLSRGPPSSQTGRQGVGYDKAHCEPSDWDKTNQWVCTLTL